MAAVVTAKDKRRTRQVLAALHLGRTPEIEERAAEELKALVPERGHPARITPQVRVFRVQLRLLQLVLKGRQPYLPNFAWASANSLLTIAPANEISSASAEAQMISASLREEYCPPAQPTNCRLPC